MATIKKVTGGIPADLIQRDYSEVRNALRDAKIGETLLIGYEDETELNGIRAAVYDLAKRERFAVTTRLDPDGDGLYVEKKPQRGTVVVEPS